ncbi:hypothetical protein CB1_000162013 [Camelus ferus]|nr:hypothetical protein CB1_000162013 [Camelus ferus]
MLGCHPRHDPEMDILEQAARPLVQVWMASQARFPEEKWGTFASGYTRVPGEHHVDPPGRSDASPFHRMLMALAAEEHWLRHTKHLNSIWHVRRLGKLATTIAVITGPDVVLETDKEVVSSSVYKPACPVGLSSGDRDEAPSCFTDQNADSGNEHSHGSDMF